MEEGWTRVSVTILNEEYALRGSSGAEHIHRLARELDDRMRRIADGSPRLSGSRIAVLAALNLAEELFQAQEQYERLKQMVEKDWRRKRTSLTKSRAEAE